MTLHPKLKGIPHIYYINLDYEVERKKYMEDQFKHWGIKKFTRVNASEFPRDDFNSWKHLVHQPDVIPSMFKRSLAVSMSHITTIKTWLETTTDPYVILMEDDTDMSLTEYWHFDWDYLMNNIPYDWDGIQLMYNSGVKMYCFLHPKKMTSWNGPILINRRYAKKLLSLYFSSNKFCFMKKVNRGDGAFYFYNKKDSNYKNHRFSLIDVDEWLGFNGKIYQLPLWSQNPYLDKIPRKHHINSSKVHKFWWEKLKNEFTLEDFFTYGKEYDNKMIFGIHCP